MSSKEGPTILNNKNVLFPNNKEVSFPVWAIVVLLLFLVVSLFFNYLSLDVVVERNIAKCNLNRVSNQLHKLEKCSYKNPDCILDYHASEITELTDDENNGRIEVFVRFIAENENLNLDSHQGIFIKKRNEKGNLFVDAIWGSSHQDGVPGGDIHFAIESVNNHWKITSIRSQSLNKVFYPRKG